MMLTIHGLPTNINYHELKLLIKHECGLSDFILDNLVTDTDGCKKVRIGLADESEGSQLLKCFGGFRLRGNVLRVVPVAKAPLNASQGNFNQRGNFPARNDMQQNQLGNFGNQPMGNRPTPWNQNSGNQWNPNQGPRPLMTTNFNYQQGPNQQFPQQQSPQLPQRLDAKPFGQREVQNRIPQDQGFRFSQKNAGPEPNRRPEARQLRSVEVVPTRDPAIQTHQSRPPQANSQTHPTGQSSRFNDKPLTINKDFFQGSSQFGGAGPPGGHFQAQPTPWNQPAQQQKPQPFGKSGQFEDERKYPLDKRGALQKDPDARNAPNTYKEFDKGNSGGNYMEYEKGRYGAPPHGRPASPGRRQSPGRRTSPGRPEPERPERSRRPSPGRKLSPGRKHSPGRRMSPGRRISPTRRLGARSPQRRDDGRDSPPRHGMRYSPGRRPLPGDKDKPAAAKPVRPAYEPEAPNQAMYSGGYRPNIHENVQYPMAGARAERRASPWHERDKALFPGQMKKDDDRRMPPRGNNVRPEPIGEPKRVSPHKSRSPTRRDERERSPLRDHYRRHSPSPRTSRRSWELEKRRSPIADAPPPPLWPGQNPDDPYVRPGRPFPEKDDKAKHVPSWERRPFEEVDSRRERQPEPGRPFKEDIRPFKEDVRTPKDEIRVRRDLVMRETSPRPGFKEDHYSSKFHREPKFEQRDPKFDPRVPKFEPRDPKFDPRDPKFMPHDPKFEPRDPKFLPRDPKFDARDHKFEPRDPKFLPRDPKFEPRDPKFMPRDPKFGPRDPKFDSRDPKFEPRDPKFEPRDPKFEPREPKFGPRDPKFEPRDPKFEPRSSKFELEGFKDQRDFRRPDDDYRNFERDDHRRGDFPRREESRKDDRNRHESFDKEFDDIYKRTVEFKQKVEELRRPERSEFREDRRREPEREDRRKYHEEPRRESDRHRDEDFGRHRPREPDWKAEIKPKHLDSAIRAKREKAAEEISAKILDKHVTFNMNDDIRSRVMKSLVRTVLGIINDMFGQDDVSFIETVIKFNAAHDHRDEYKIFQEVMGGLPNQRPTKRPGEESSEIPAKTSRRSPENMNQDLSSARPTDSHNWEYNLEQQNLMSNMMMSQMLMNQGLNPMMVPSPFAPAFEVPQEKNFQQMQQQDLPEETAKEDGFNLYLCKTDFKPFLNSDAEYVKNYLITELLKVNESGRGWAPDFTLKGLQSQFRYLVHTRDEASKEWLVNLDYSKLNVLVYTKEELWYERAAIWLPGHSRCRNIEPLVKLKLQNRKLEGVNIDKWKLVKKTVNAKGTRVYVDLPPASARALEQHNMLLSYELQKVSVFLKAVAVDKEAFESGLKENSIEDQAEIVKAVQNSPMPMLPNEQNIVKITLKGTKSMTLEQARKIKEIVIYNLFKYLQSEVGNSSTDFVRYGFCSPDCFGVVPENEESKRWLSALDIGRMNRHPIVVVGADDGTTRFYKMTVSVPQDYGLRATRIMEKLRMSNHGVKGLNFSMWKPDTMMHTKGRKCYLDIEIDFESVETLSNMNFKLDFAMDLSRPEYAYFKYERSTSKLLELLSKHRAELKDSYDVANMEISDQDDDDDIICLDEA